MFPWLNQAGQGPAAQNPMAQLMQLMQLQQAGGQAQPPRMSVGPGSPADLQMPKAMPPPGANAQSILGNAASAQAKPGGIQGFMDSLNASPTNLGLLAGGLSALGGAPLDQALQTGFGAYGTVDGIVQGKRKREAIDKFTKGLSPQDAAMAKAFPSIYAQSAAQAQFRKPDKVTLSSLGKLMSERDALAPNDPNRAAYNARIRKLGEAAAPMGVQLSVGPDGSVNASMGPGAGATGAGAVSNRGPNFARHGETVSTGAGVAQPRDAKQAGKKYSDADARIMEDIRGKAINATELRHTVANARSLLPSIGHTGRGADKLRALDEVAEAGDDALKYFGFIDEKSDLLGRQIPGSTGSRQAFDMVSTKMVVDATSMLKGAISEKEIELLNKLPPSFANTREGNELIIKVIEAGAVRLEMRADFYEKYGGAHGGSLQGAEAAWSNYIDNNRVFDFDSKGGFEIKPMADMAPYISGQHQRRERLPMPAQLPQDLQMVWPNMTTEDQQKVIDGYGGNN